ncbi:MAG: MarR family transcriptional regulator, partial [Pseudomonadota bacterium]
TWKRLERRALDGLDDKERRNLRKLLKKVEKNISKSGDLPDDDEDEDEENTTVVKLIPENF